MLTARDDAGALILADDATRESAYACPECLDHVILKRGAIVIPHFAHEAYSGCPLSEGESQRHLEMKLQIGRIFEKTPLFPTVRFEVRFEASRRADVVLDEHLVVVECQASPISVLEICARTSFYNEHGYSVLWVFDAQRIPDDLDWRGRHQEVRIPAELRYVHAATYGHLYVLTADGSLMGCHLARAGARDTEYGSYYPKTLRWVSYHPAGAVPIGIRSSMGDLLLTKLSEGVWWKK